MANNQIRNKTLLICEIFHLNDATIETRLSCLLKFKIASWSGSVINQSSIITQATRMNTYYLLGKLLNGTKITFLLTNPDLRGEPPG